LVETPIDGRKLKPVKSSKLQPIIWFGVVDVVIVPVVVVS